MHIDHAQEHKFKQVRAEYTIIHTMMMRNYLLYVHRLIETEST